MTTAAKNNFDTHIGQCTEAIHIYEFLGGHGYSADFGLRFVWVASLSALDHYISELIVEKSTEHYANGKQLSDKILNEAVPFSSMITMHGASPASAVLEFRTAIANSVRFRTFQKADDLADGLSFVWNEKHKWNKISDVIGIEGRSARRKLNSICYRRDAIVHSADHDETTHTLRPCNLNDAVEASGYVMQLVEVIDSLVP
jgi:hypothetical protein